MSSTPSSPPPHPSWRLPIALGAMATIVLHAPALVDNLLWVPLLGTCGCSGIPTGVLATLLALRKEPGMGAASGFGVAFIAAGVGALLVATATALFGFHLTDDDLEMLRRVLADGGAAPQKIDDTLGQLQDRGAVSVVVVGAMVALWSGITGAAVAAFRARRLRAASTPELPPRLPPRA